jgi:pilus assembly protein CpaB
MGSNETRNLWLSAIAGIFAIFLVYSYSQEKKAEYDKLYGAKKTIVVAKEDITEMSTIYDNMVESKDVPAEYLVPDSIMVREEVVGNVAAIPVKKGQVLLKNMLLTPGPDTGIAHQVAPSSRAVTIPIDEVRGVAKLIRPGDRVDVLAAVDVGKGVNQHREVSLLMQDVPVLATGVSVINNIPRLIELDSSGKSLTQTSLTGDSKYATITVEASLKESQDLVYILSTSPGNLYFVLRNPNDRKKLTERMPASTAETVLGKPAVEVAPRSPSGPEYGNPSLLSPNRQQPRGNSPRTNGFKSM